MPFTVITLKKVPLSLRGDLTKWMQEIATGVYVGNFNTKVREQLWNRVKENVAEGEATISFAYRNEIGYQFDTLHTQRIVIDSDGIPLILSPSAPATNSGEIKLKTGYSNAAKFRKARKFISYQQEPLKYVVIDIETDGLDAQKHSIIEIGAVKLVGSEIKEFNCLIWRETSLPHTIIQLTGITSTMLADGVNISLALRQFLEFIGDSLLVGYNIDFDLAFLNKALEQEGLERLSNHRVDLLKYVRQECLFLDNYQLQTALRAYGIDETVPHRATLDAKLIHALSLKVNKFQQRLKKK